MNKRNIGIAAVSFAGIIFVFAIASALKAHKVTALAPSAPAWTPPADTDFVVFCAGLAGTPGVYLADDPEPDRVLRMINAVSDRAGVIRGLAAVEFVLSLCTDSINSATDLELFAAQLGAARDLRGMTDSFVATAILQIYRENGP